MKTKRKWSTPYELKLREDTIGCTLWSGQRARGVCHLYPAIRCLIVVCFSYTIPAALFFPTSDTRYLGNTQPSNSALQAPIPMSINLV